jgi:hypothetical protein
MPQDSESGAKANIYGKKTSRLIAKKIGATPLTENSNEFALDGLLITIRCAHKGNLQVGVTKEMLRRIDKVIAAFEIEKDVYELYEMSPCLYKKHIRYSRKERVVGLVRKQVFVEEAKALGFISLKKKIIVL